MATLAGIRHIGLISDTHGLLRPDVHDALQKAHQDINLITTRLNAGEGSLGR